MPIRSIRILRVHFTVLTYHQKCSTEESPRKGQGNDGINIFVTGKIRNNLKMEIYHGSYTTIPMPEIKKSQFTKDFGDGFYCTGLRRQAEKWAKRYDTPVVNIYDYQQDGTLNILRFEEMTDEWLDFIVACRSGKPHDYDIVIGAMANDQVYNYVADFINGVLTREQFWVLAKFKYPTHQINFCTPRALRCITFKGSEEIIR